ASAVMGAAQALNIATLGLIYGWWAWALAGAARGERSGLVATFALSGLWSFLGNGVLGLAGAPPPTAALPHQDAAHLGNIVCGGLALWALWPAVRAGRAAGDWRAVLIPLALLVSSYFLNTILFLSR